MGDMSASMATRLKAMPPNNQMFVIALVIDRGAMHRDGVCAHIYNKGIYSAEIARTKKF